MRPGRSFFRYSGGQEDEGDEARGSTSAGRDSLARREHTQVLAILGGGRPVTMGEVMEEIRAACYCRQSTGSGGSGFSMAGRVDGFMDADSF